jgi:hypothetical protein
MLLGRLPERAALNQLLEAARAGRSGVLVMCGEPGVGKTALLEYAVESAAGLRVARSSHCASSITHKTGRSAATSARRLSVASPTRNRSGAPPACSPNATPSASRCGPGSRSSQSSIGAHTC